jgi:hypothetical protein
VETSYLLDLGEGALYTEKQITPLRLKDAPRKRPHTLPLRVSSAGLYPGFSPFRLKLIEFEETAATDDLWDRVIELSETSATALRQRLSQSTSSLVAPQEAYSLFKPASVVSRGESIYLVDGEMKSIPIGRHRRRPLYGLLDALRGGQVGALFCRVRFAEDGMEAEPLSVILAQGELRDRLVRLSA